MLRKIENLSEGIIGIKASGTLTKQDYEEFMAPLLAEIHRTGKRTKFLYHFCPDFEGFTLGAAWQDFKLGMRNIRLFSGCAIVSDKDWLRKSADFVGTMLPCPVRSFSENDYQQALDWLNDNEAGSIEHWLDTNKNILLVKPSRPLTKSDFDCLAHTVDPWIEQKHDLNGLVIHTKSFPGWQDLGSIIRHFQFVKAHHLKIKKVAVVADGRLAEMFPSLADHFVAAQIEHFNYDDLERALEWASV